MVNVLMNRVNATKDLVVWIVPNDAAQTIAMELVCATVVSVIAILATVGKNVV